MLHSGVLFVFPEVSIDVVAARLHAGEQDKEHSGPAPAVGTPRSGSGTMSVCRTVFTHFLTW